MRLIDVDALLNEHCGRVLWGEYKSCAECYEDNGKECYHEIDAQDIMDAPTIASEPFRAFAEWVASTIFEEGYETNWTLGAFAEVACRKLEKLGVVTKEGENWHYEDDRR